MLAWMNAEALQLTIDTGRAVYWSRSQRPLAQGDTSGHEHIVEIRVDCDQDAVLSVRQTAPPAHRSPFVLLPHRSPGGLKEA
jgi:phosphoribosyl-AMP cyclohydrolase